MDRRPKGPSLERDPGYANARQGGSLKLWFTILIASLDNGALAAGRLVLPLVALQVGAGAALVGVMSGLFTALPMVFSVRFGRWVDRTGTLVPILFASLLIVASSLLFMVFPTPYMLLPIAGLIGAGAVFAHVASSRAVVGAYERSERARNLGFLVVSYSAFQFLCPMVASLSFDHVGGRAAILTIGAFSVLAMIGLALPFHHYRRETAAAAPADGGGFGLLRLTELRTWIIVSSVFSGSQTILPFVVSLHAIDIGLSASQAGLVFGAFAFGTVVSRLCIGFISRTFVTHAVLTVALLIGAAIYALVPLAREFPILMALSATLGLPLGIGVPLSLNLIYDAAPGNRVNEAVGLCMSVTNFIQMMLPLTLGFVAGGLGIAAMTWLIALMLVLPIMLTLRAGTNS